jgi:menaquinone-dependent protoporphyrinogen oxidase
VVLVVKILVSVSSRHGGTAELGARIAQGLRDGGHEVDLIPPDNVTTVSYYGGVVLGTSVYIGRAGLDLKDLVDRETAALRGRPVWMFWSGPVDDRLENTPSDDVVDVARHATARQRHMFGGRMYPSVLTGTEKSLLPRAPVQAGDRRDLDSAYAWGRQIAADIATAAAQVPSAPTPGAPQASIPVPQPPAPFQQPAPTQTPPTR